MNKEVGLCRSGDAPGKAHMLPFLAEAAGFVHSGFPIDLAAFRADQGSILAKMLFCQNCFTQFTGYHCCLLSRAYRNMIQNPQRPDYLPFRIPGSLSTSARISRNSSSGSWEFFRFSSHRFRVSSSTVQPSNIILWSTGRIILQMLGKVDNKTDSKKKNIF